MLTDYFSCYKLNNKFHPLIHQNLKIVKFSMYSKFCGIQTLMFINFKKKKKLYF